MTNIQQHIQRIDNICAQAPVIPVLKLDNAEQAIGVCTALVRGGLKVLEITLRNDYGLQAIKQISEALPDAIVGAGTVTTPEQYEACIDAGADFIVSPGATPKLLAHGAQASIPLLPGVASVSEAMAGMELGYERFKLFPAVVVGGTDLLKAFYGPLANLKFCPTGGIKPSNVGQFLELPNVMCVGGTWMTPNGLLATGDWSAIENLAREASQLKGTPTE
ncbi:MAG: bifunctional 4-hydroxy-2-oxoglutarate aldolase/2-dehydro-3-deoxy-phosphogluconate aldolase [Gammaproteobacteria bacterium]|nr:bifunctional 4-hydroxy-2-oxoglutarate aldolase/2-dehydro-3-deoxy-phosphogluconate aldolase [Gammaproteobacteria bacterium]MCP4879074.1 bifunctional 4-hydroxy-2-oxoglutarate aldolase/2-dehydro-3-deoxy-phosphogluconate aldolase [Gammaproteobacteria bacterium]